MRAAAPLPIPADRRPAHQARVFLLLFALVSALYLLSYRARMESGDTVRALDAMTSQSRYGDWLLDESGWLASPLRVREEQAWPIRGYDVEERLQLRLALPLLRIAEVLPRLGNVHSVWLFNIFVAALSVGLVYLILRSLAYDDLTSLIVALTTAFATNLWAYSQTFFREPLAGLLLLLAIYLIQLGKGCGSWRQLLGIAAGLGALYLAALTKNSAIFALPAIVIFALPRPKRFDHPRLRSASTALLAASLILLLAALFIDPLTEALQRLWLGVDPSKSYAAHALRVYLLSPGGSLWATSPPLLLAAAGGMIWLRQGHHGRVWTLILLIASYASLHALATGPHWFGGLSWPPRFLLPITAIAMLACAPIVRMILRDRRRPLIIIFLALLAYGVWIQFCAVSLSLQQYGGSLPGDVVATAEWLPGLTQPRFFRWVALPSRWRELGIDFLWIRSGAPLWGLSFAIYALAAALLLRSLLRHPKSRWRHLAGLFPIALLPMLYANLSAVYTRDPVTRSGESAMHALLSTFPRGDDPIDVLLLPDHLYIGFMLNHHDRPNPRPIVLHPAPAQAVSDKTPAQLRTDNPNLWLDLPSFRALHHLASKHDRLFLLANTSPFMTWSFRPYERYLSLHYYPLGEIELAGGDGVIRLLEYSARQPAPNPMALYLGEAATDFVFADHIRLLGFSLPSGRRYQPGQTLELSLLWQADRQPRHDYTVATFVVAAGTGAPAAQGFDSAPMAGFAPTSGWQANWPIWDNRGLRLPPTMPPGDYSLWVLMYRFVPGSGEILRAPVTGSQVAEDGAAAVLPIIVTLE